MNLPTSKPGSSAFMIFAMLLLGVFAAAIVMIFDYWNPVENKSLTIIIMKKMKESEIPILWITTVGGLTLMASGFFFYLASFFFITVPTLILRYRTHPLSQSGEDLFTLVSSQSLARFVPTDIATVQSRRFRDGFMYLLLTSRDTPIAAAARFSFTQVMYARSVGGILLLFTAYVSWIHSLSPQALVGVVLLVWASVCCLYSAGLSFFESVVTSGILIERLHENPKTPESVSKRTTAQASKTDA